MEFAGRCNGMRIFCALLPVAILLGGCDARTTGADGTAEVPRGISETAGTAPDESVGASSPAAPPVSTPTFERLPIGEYRLAGADGADVNVPHGISVSVTADTIAIASQCVTPRWTYRYEQGRLRTEPIIEAICDRGRYPAEEALSAVFDDPQAILRTPSNGFEVSGGGHSVTLYSQ